MYGNLYPLGCPCGVKLLFQYEYLKIFRKFAFGMAKKIDYQLDIEIDKLTNSIANRVTGDSFNTEVLRIEKFDLQTLTMSKGWRFDWKHEARQRDRQVFKLTIIGNPKIVQGVISISDKGDHYYLHLIESAPFNVGRNKVYEGVSGNLFAFACKLSWDKGYQGFVAFQSKTRLISHYEETLGATHIGSQNMIIFSTEALRLIKQYFLK